MSTGSTVFRIRDNEQFDLTIEEVDAAGNSTGPLPPDIVPSWSTSYPEVLTVEVKDSMTATVKTTGKLGTCQVSVSVQTVDKTLTGLLDVDVVVGDATTVTLVPTNISVRV